MGMKASSGLFFGTKGALKRPIKNKAQDSNNHKGWATHRKQESPPIKKAGDLRFSKKKMESYLLNENHPVGGPKAKFMKKVLGYDKSDAKLFHKRIVSAIIGKLPNKTTETQFGLKHQFNVSLIGKKGKSVKAKVVVIIQKDKGRKTYKLITVYPDRKEK